MGNISSTWDWVEHMDSSWSLSPPGSNHVCADAWTTGAWHVFDVDGSLVTQGMEDKEFWGRGVAIAARITALSEAQATGFWPKGEGSTRRFLRGQGKR